eukprot:1051757-Pleurochrysis_carterae.AAC.1
MKALSLQWAQVAPASAARGAAANAAEARAWRVVPSAWLSGEGSVPRVARCRASQLRMLGLAASTAGAGTQMWALAVFLAAAGGESVAVDAVEEALSAAQSADEGEAPSCAVQQRLAEAGTACTEALRGALDALGVEGALTIMDEMARMHNDLGVQ